MFERYTDTARRVVFYARFEAMQLGSASIEPEHLLLGLAREDRGPTKRFSERSIDSMRRQIEARAVREKAPVSIDPPLSPESKRVLAHAAEEAERLSHEHISTAHLLIGLLREGNGLAAEILHEGGFRLESEREELSRKRTEEIASVQSKQTPPVAQFNGTSSLLSEFSRDLTQAAKANELDPLIGREQELQRLIQILCRRTRNNPVLIGEPGIGKAAMVKGLALRIAEGTVPPILAHKRILAVEISAIIAGARQSGQLEARLRSIVRELVEAQDVLIFMEELYALQRAQGFLEVANILKPALVRGALQCIAAAAPGDHRHSIELEPWLDRYFHVVRVSPPTEAEAVRILLGLKERYERFHGVRYTDEALECAVHESERHIPDRYLPDKAIDLIDEAGACVKLRTSVPSHDVLDLQKRVELLALQKENAVANHKFEEAREYSEEERKELENLRLLREKPGAGENTAGIVTRQDIEAVLAHWAETSFNEPSAQGMQ